MRTGKKSLELQSIHRMGSYPDNLLKALFDKAYTDEILDRPTSEGMADILGSIDYVLEAAPMTHRQKQIMIMRFQEGKILQEIADEFHISEERVRQDILSAEAIMRRGIYGQIIRYGVEGYIRNKVEEQIQLQLPERVEEEIRRRLLQKEDGGAGMPSGTIRRTVLLDKYADVNIAELGLSTRSYNGLTRAGIDTIGKLVHVRNGRELRSIPQLGERSCNEIMEALKRLGLPADHLKF